MKIVTQGLSRLVFIHGDYAIKIPWINFVKLIECFLRYEKEGVFNKKAKRYGENRILALFNYIYYILSSNRREYLYYKKHQNEKHLVPIIRAFLFGLIIIQPKGKVLSHSHIRWKNLLGKITEKGIKHVDLVKPENFCEFNDDIRLLDYAGTETQYMLDFDYEIPIIIRTS